jgi:hypothetical protein
MSNTHRHPVFARVYPRISHAAERRGGAEHRRTLLDGLQGRVIEIGAGHGVNFPYYAPGVSHVEERIVFKPSPVMPAIPHILGAARIVRSTT